MHDAAVLCAITLVPSAYVSNAGFGGVMWPSPPENVAIAVGVKTTLDIYSKLKTDIISSENVHSGKIYRGCSRVFRLATVMNLYLLAFSL